jgi:hypothetical protein
MADTTGRIPLWIIGILWFLKYVGTTRNCCHFLISEIGQGRLRTYQVYIKVVQLLCDDKIDS